jgi:hypothetical protein
LNSYKHKYETIKNKNAINKSYGYVSNTMKMKTKTQKMRFETTEITSGA